MIALARRKQLRICSAVVGAVLWDHYAVNAAEARADSLFEQSRSGHDLLATLGIADEFECSKVLHGDTGVQEDSLSLLQLRANPVRLNSNETRQESTTEAMSMLSNKTSFSASVQSDKGGMTVRSGPAAQVAMVVEHAEQHAWPRYGLIEPDGTWHDFRMPDWKIILRELIFIPALLFVGWRCKWYLLLVIVIIQVITHIIITVTSFRCNPLPWCNLPALSFGIVYLVMGGSDAFRRGKDEKIYFHTTLEASIVFIIGLYIVGSHTYATWYHWQAYIEYQKYITS